MYVVLGMSTFLACLVTYFIYKIKRIAIFALSAFLGVILALQLYMFVAFNLEALRKQVPPSSPSTSSSSSAFSSACSSASSPTPSKNR